MKSKELRVLDVRIDNLSRKEALGRTESFLNVPRFHQIVTPGPEFILEASANPEFRTILNAADLALPDGMGLHLAALLQARRLRGRIPGADFVEDLMSLAAKRGSGVFLFGGQPAAADRSAAVLLRRYPGLRIVGTESGWRGPWQKLHDRQVVQRIQRAKPEILLVGLGAPKQELWIYRHRLALPSVRVAIGVGRTIDYLGGLTKRAPALVRRSGFEWLHTYLKAGSFYQPELRRRRIKNATWDFLLAVARRGTNR